MDGELIYEIGDNKLVYTDGDYDYPEITKVVEIDISGNDENEFAKELIRDGEKGNQIENAVAFVKSLFGEESVRTTTRNTIKTNQEYSTEATFERGNRNESSGADSDSQKDVRFSIYG